MNDKRRALYLGFRRGWLQAVLLGMPVLFGVSLYLDQPEVATLAALAFVFAVYVWCKVERRRERHTGQVRPGDADDETPTRHTYRLQCVGYPDCTHAQRSAGCIECVRVRTR